MTRSPVPPALPVTKNSSAGSRSAASSRARDATITGTEAPNTLDQISDPKRVDLSSIVREARASSSLSQADLAQKSGVSVHAVWELEARGNGTVDLLTRVLNTLEVRIAGLPPGKSFGERVRKTRLRRDWSQEELAAKAGVSAPAIIRLERDRARISTLEAVLRVLTPKARVARDRGGQYKSGNKDFRFTPRDVLARIERVIGPIDLDPAADRGAHVTAKRYFYAEDDGLSQKWQAHTVFCNSPYSRMSSFTRKAFAEWNSGACRIVLLLLPAKTEVASFHDCIVGHADTFFLRRSIRFERPEGDGGSNKAPFSPMIVIYGADQEMINRMLCEFDCVHLSKGAAVGRRAVSE